jgi:phosphatidylglycerophosphate synthase
MKAKSIREKAKPVTGRIGKFFGKFASPDFYTFLTLVFGLLAVVSLSQGWIAGTIVLFAVSGFFDWVDGAVAKAYGKATRFGIVFDSSVDKITEGLLYLGFAWYSNSLLWPAVLAATAFWFSSYESKVAYEINANAQGGLLERRERLIGLVLAVIFLGVNPNWSGWVLYLLAIGSFITAIERFFRIKKQAEAKA